MIEFYFWVNYPFNSSDVILKKTATSAHEGDRLVIEKEMEEERAIWF